MAYRDNLENDETGQVQEGRPFQLIATQVFHYESGATKYQVPFWKTYIPTLEVFHLGLFSIARRHWAPAGIGRTRRHTFPGYMYVPSNNGVCVIMFRWLESAGTREYAPGTSQILMVKEFTAAEASRRRRVVWEGD